MATGISFAADNKVCVICQKVIETNEKCCVVKNGYDNLLDYSVKYGKTELVSYLESKPEEVIVHSNCRKVLTCKVRYEQYLKKRAKENAIGESDTTSKRLRSGSAPFDWKKQCYLCGVSGNSEFSRAETEELLKHTQKWCSERNDDWSQEVLDRLLMCSDLIQVEARYHPTCLIYFSSKRAKPGTQCASARPGRPVDQLKLDAFIKVCEWLETTDNDIFTLAELKYLQTDEFNPEDWGWRLIEGRFVPIASNKPPAPDELLNIVRCKCQNDSENQCGKPPCSCVVNGLNCVAACKHCSGVSCNNPTKAVMESSMEEADLLDTCDELYNVDGCDGLLESFGSHKVTEDLLEFLIPWASEVEVEFH